MDDTKVSDPGPASWMIKWEHAWIFVGEKTRCYDVEGLFVCLFVQFKSCAFPKMNVRVQVGRVFELESTEMILKACNDSSTLQKNF